MPDRRPLKNKPTSNPDFAHSVPFFDVFTLHFTFYLVFLHFPSIGFGLSFHGVGRTL